MMSLYITFYTYCQVGLFAYSGKITDKNCPGNGLYYLLNFNDLGMGLNTLFVYFVGNNWQNVANMYASLFGPVWPRVFFTVWYTFAQFILLNLIIAFVMEIYLYNANRI